jgi:uncharacterized protein (DUF305 family)
METKNIAIGVAVGLVIGFVVGYVVLSAKPMNMDSHNDDHHDADIVMPNIESEMDDMHAMHGDMMVANEKDFLTGMIPHHEEAVATAQEVLARGATTPEIKALAENIVSSQTREIALMKQWYEEWYGTPYVPTGDYKPMMRDLSQLSGAALDRVFLEDMIHHHMGALMMAKSVDAVIEHEDLHTLVHEIEEAQAKEIAMMQAYLKTLPQ